MAGAGEADLATLLASLAPVLDDRVYAFCCVQPADIVDCVALQALATFDEAEGMTVVLPVARAAELGFGYHGEFRRITLTVHSSLQAVGLTAAVAGALAAAGISANVIAAYHHDHVFVPAARADAALAVLRRLADRAGDSDS